MDKLVLLFAFFLCALPAHAGSERAQQPPRAVSVGNPAPDFVLTNMQGEKVRLSQLRGKVVIVNFWASWCPPCKLEMPSMETLHQSLEKDGLVLLAINVEKEGRRVVEAFLKETPYSFPILLDTEGVAQKRYGVYQYPESFIIDRNGVIVRKVIGAVNWTGGDLFNLLRFMVKG